MERRARLRDQVEGAGIDRSSMVGEGRGKPVGEAIGVLALGVGREQDECPRRGDGGTAGEQSVQVVGEAPSLTARTVAVRRRVEDDAVVASSSASLPCDERRGIVDEPADRPVGEP